MNTEFLSENLKGKYHFQDAMCVCVCVYGDSTKMDINEIGYKYVDLIDTIHDRVQCHSLENVLTNQIEISTAVKTSNHGNEPSGATKGREYLEKLSDY
jgi:hypothetical protein